MSKTDVKQFFAGRVPQSAVARIAAKFDVPRGHADLTNWLRLIPQGKAK
jgi:hypothetical protein